MEYLFIKIMLQCLAARYIASTRTLINGKIQEGAKGDELFCCWWRQEEGKLETDWKKSGGDTASKGIEAAHCPFRRSTRNHSYTTQTKTRETEAEEAKNQDWFPLKRGYKKETAGKVSINVSTFHHFTFFILCTNAPYLFHHFTIMR